MISWQQQSQQCIADGTAALGYKFEDTRVYECGLQKKRALCQYMSCPKEVEQPDPSKRKVDDESQSD